MTTKFKHLHLTFAGQIETVETAAELPLDGVIEGAIRYIKDTDSVTTFDGTAWVGLNIDTLTVNNLTVNNLAYINANVVEIGDNIIVLNNEVTGAPTEDAGLCVERGTEPDACIIWDETNDTWTVGVNGDMVPIPGTPLAFTTIATPAGTNPVADSATDTLTLTTANGVSITGTAATDSVAIALDAASSPTLTGLTVTGVAASRALVTDGSSALAPSATTATELGYLSGVTSAVQVQLNAKQPLDAELTALAGLTSAADQLPYFTGSGTAALTTLSSFARTLLDDANAATALTTLGAQPLDATLTALAAYNTNGLLTQTAADTFVGRTLTGTLNRLTITNGDGGAGNPTLDISTSYAGQATITTLGTVTTGVWNGTDVAVADGGTGASTASGARTNLGLVIGTDVQAFDSDLSALAANATNGLWARTGAGTGSARTLTAGSSKVSVGNGDGVSGNPTVDVVEANLTLSSIGGSVTDAQVPNTITLDNITQITTRPHSSLTSLSADDHTQYALLAGRSGGQTLTGGTASGNNLTLQSTTHATKGKILFDATTAYDEANGRFGVGTTSPTALFSVANNFLVDATGNVGVNQSPSATAQLSVTKDYADPAATAYCGRLLSIANSLTSTNANTVVGFQAAVRLNQGSSDATAATGAIHGFNTAVYASGASGTVTAAYSNYALGGNLGAGTLSTYAAYLAATTANSGGGTLTTNHGFYVQAQTVGTNIYGFRGSIASTAGRYNLYMDGTAANYLAGNLGIGNSGPQTALEVSAVSDPTIRVSEGSSTTNYLAITDVATNQARITKFSAAGIAPVLDFDADPADGSSAASVRYFRNTTTTGVASVQVFAAGATQNSQIGGIGDSYLNSNNGLVGIGRSSPGAQLHIASVSNALSLASWGAAGIGLRVDAATYTNTTTGAGTLTAQAAHGIATPSFNSTNVITITNAATLYIGGSPAATGNTTITNPWGIWLDSGNARFDGAVGIGNISATPVSDLEVSSQTQIDGSDPTTITIRSTTNSSTWTTDAHWGRLDFWSNDLSALGSAPRARIAAAASSSSGAGTNLIFYTDSGGVLTEAFRFTNNSYAQFGGSTASSMVAITSASTAPGLLRIDAPAGHANDAIGVVNNGTRFFTATSGLTVNIGTQTTTAAKLHVMATTEQLRVGYDASNYVSHTVASTGGLTVATATNAAAGAPITLTASASNTAGSAGGALTLNAGAGVASGSGGAGGAVTLNGGAANGNNTVNRTGGAVTLQAGSSKGSSVGGACNVTSGTGGAGTGTAGAAGGALNLTAGTGGVGSATSGAGGALIALAGDGGGGVAGATGGGLTLAAGTGGSGTSSSATGGTVTLRGGLGGADGGGGAGAGGALVFQTAATTSLTEAVRITNAQRLGVGTGATVSAKLHSLATTEQLRLGYDVSNYFSTTVGSTGGVTFDAVGAGAGFTFNDSVTHADATNLVVGTTTGSKIGTATTQKLGFYNATPIVQRSGAAQAAVATTGATNIAPFGFTTAAQADALVTLVNELRAWAVAQGFIKGSA